MCECESIKIFLPSCVNGAKCVFGFTSCCLLCLSVAVTPGYFCCRGTSLLPSPSLSSFLTLCQTSSLYPFDTQTLNPLNIRFIFSLLPLCMSVSVGALGWGCVWGLRLMPASIMLLILFRPGLVFFCLFLRVPNEHRKIKKARTGCGQTVFLILLQALKRVCSRGTNYRLYLAYGAKIIWCVTN